MQVRQLSALQLGLRVAHRVHHHMAALAWRGGPDIVYFATIVWIALPLTVLLADAVVQPDHSEDSESWLAEVANTFTFGGTFWTILACAWSLHLGMLHQVADDQIKWIFYEQTRFATQLLGLSRLVYLLNKMIMYPLPVLCEAALTTAPYAAAFYSHTLLISAAEQLASGERVPLLWGRTEGRVRERTPLLQWNAWMTGSFYTLFALAIATDWPMWRGFLALAGTLTHTYIYLNLAYHLHVASIPLWDAERHAVPFCGGSFIVRVGAAHRAVCVSLVVQAFMTLLSLFARPWFQRNFAFAQIVFFGAEMVPTWILPIAVVPIPQYNRRRYYARRRDEARAAEDAADEQSREARPRLRGGAAEVGRRGRLLATLQGARETAHNHVAPPLDEEAMRSVVWRCKQLAADGDAGDGCSICLEPMLRGETVLPLGCAHVFHAECLLSWLSRSASCPLCKAAVHPETCRAAESVPYDVRRPRPPVPYDVQ